MFNRVTPRRINQYSIGHILLKLFDLIICFSCSFDHFSFYIWLNVVTTVSTLLQVKRICLVFTKVELKVSFISKYPYCYWGVLSDPPTCPSHRGLTEQIKDNISLSLNHWLGNLEIRQSRQKKGKCGWICLQVLCLVAHYLGPCADGRWKVGRSF